MIYHLPQRKLTERDIDAQIMENRENYIAACCGGCDGQQCTVECVIPTDTSWAARFLRWSQEWWRVVQFRVRVWWACRGKPPF